MKRIASSLRATLFLVFASAALLGSADASDLQAQLRAVSARNAMAELVRDALTTIRRQAQDFKNLLLRGSDPAEYRLHTERFETQKKGYREKLERLRAAMQDVGLPLARIDGLLVEQERLIQAYAQALTQFDQADKQSTFRADLASKGKDVRSFVELDALIAEIDRDKAAALAGLSEAIAKEVARCP